ncbi:MAG: serine hydrolase [Saprospiraceae bacterium]|nr:serine hydrolase [Saprospiraceae bacterium]
MRNCTFLVLILLLRAGLLPAQLPADLKTALDKTLDSMRTKLGNKSLSAAIAFPQYTWARATGVNSVSPATQVTVQHAYLIGSVTKPITAACILQLVEEGKLSLDDSLYQYVDTIPNINPNITIRQLLQHRSGIFDVLYNPALNQAFALNPGKVWQAEDLLRLYNQPPNDPPGGAWDYSNPNFWLLGMVIERIEGKPFYTVYRERFFTPLELKSFAIPAFEPLPGPVAHAWIDLNGDGITDDAHTWYMGNKALNSAAGAAGGFFATPSDLANWMRRYLRGDLLSAALLNEAKNTFFALGAQGNQYGLGLMKNTLAGSLCYGHGGDLAYSASAWYFPDCDLAISVLNNDGTNQGGQPKYSSWTLLPVVAALYQAARPWCAALDAPEPAAASALEVWPNPAQDRIHIRLGAEGLATEPLVLELLDAQGRVALRQPWADPASVSGETVVALPARLQAGVYVLRLSGERYASAPVRVVLE